MAAAINGARFSYGKMLRMKLWVVVAAACAALTLSAPTAEAQTDRRFGLVIGYPTSVGLEWQAADRFAIRFDGTYRHSTLESSSTPPSGGVALGASHNIGPRLRIFGEAGLTYSRGAIDGIPFNDITQTSFGLRSGVGAVVLF